MEIDPVIGVPERTMGRISGPLDRLLEHTVLRASRRLDRWRRERSLRKLPPDIPPPPDYGA